MIVRWGSVRSCFSDHIYCIFRMNNITMKKDIRQQPEHHTRCLLIQQTVLIPLRKSMNC